MNSLLYSRKFWLAVFAVIQAVLFQFFPDIPDELWQAIVAIVGILIAAIAVEDAGAKIGQGNGSSPGHG